jgi:concanavalin A-like lectin/glucanase superfamily protein
MMVGALLAALILLGAVDDAGAATLQAEYLFQGNLASEIAGAPDLANIGSGNSFATERINGLGLQQVLRFPEGNGLSLATAGLVNPTNNSVVIVFRLADTHGYRRILDLAGGVSDHGLYNLNGHVALYGAGSSSESVVLSNSYAEIALTNAAVAGDSEQVTAYLNGTKVASGTASEGFDLGSGQLRLFRDNTSGAYPGEESSGAVSCLLVYDGALTANEVSRVANDQTLCPAPTPAQGRARASVTGKPEAIRSGRSTVVDTGLTVSCPIGPKACPASGRVDATLARGGAARRKRLGVVRFTVSSGESRSVQVRLPQRGAKALRDAGAARVRVSVEIKANGRTARAQQSGIVDAPRPPAFRPGKYTGTTSQDLPISIAVNRTEVRSVTFHWRDRCADGETHTNTVILRGRARVRHGRFSLGAHLNSGGSARVSGQLHGDHASGTLSRVGASISGARCEVKHVRWQAHTSGVEIGTSER